LPGRASIDPPRTECENRPELVASDQRLAQNKSMDLMSPMAGLTIAWNGIT